MLEETVSKNAKRDEARRSTLGDTNVVTLNSSVDFGTPSRSAKTSVDFGIPAKTTSVDYGTPAQYGSMHNEDNRVRFLYIIDVV